MAHATETSVKWFYGQMQAAPWPTSWTGTTGAAQVLCDILKACLVNGFNNLTFDSIVVTGGVAKASRTNGHGFVFDQIVSVAGATPSGLNGEKRVLAVTSQTIEFDATGVADGAASGTITIKTAPAGWQLAFDSTTKIALRSQAAVSPKSFFVIDESVGDRTSRMMYAFADMTDINTGTGQWASVGCVTPSNNSGNYVPAQWSGGRWMVIADNRTAWIICVSRPNDGLGPALGILTILGFGDFASFLAADAGNEFVMGAYPESMSNSRYHPGGAMLGAYRTAVGEVHSMLRANGLGATALNNCGAYGAHNINGASGHGGPSFPSPVDNGLLLADSLFRETTDGSLRGKNRGLYWCMQDRPFSEAHPGMTVTGISGLEGRTLMLLPFTPYNRDTVVSPANNGRVAIDITGPWS
jgi:hypothetical protein